MTTYCAVPDTRAPAEPIRSPLRETAEFAALTALLNCYIREFAQPAGQVRIANGGNLPQALTSRFIKGEIVVVDLAASGLLLAIKADHWSLLARGRYSSAPFIKAFGKPWRALDSDEAMAVLREEMERQLGQPINPELAEQIENSVQVTQAFLETPQVAGADGYIQSEQSLIWGHPLHPTPKSRGGVYRQELLACSPEVGARFPLHWFRIDPRLLQHQGEPQAADWISRSAGGEQVYPCHPWELTHILASPLYQEAQSLGLITPLGARGAEFFPTSSVRTLYRPGLPWQLKCSIHVRLTNCVRKNAWYELESAVALNSLLAPCLARLENACQGFRVMREPSASSLDFSLIPGADAREVRHLQECFGILYRENLPASELADGQVEMAATLFSCDRQGERFIAPFIVRLAARRRLTFAAACEQWLAAYLEALLPGVLGAFFDEGIIFEPHLQNTLIGLRDDLPCRVWVRDLEGTKLDPHRWPAGALARVSERARQSLWYSREKGWQRVAYCVLINNLSEAMFRLAEGDRGLERRLWGLLAERLAAWSHEPEIAALLAGAPIPSKNNLRIRLLQKADRQADYTMLAHPMGGRP